MSRLWVHSNNNFNSLSIRRLVVEFALASDSLPMRTDVLHELFARTRLVDDAFATLSDRNQLSTPEDGIDVAQVIPELLAWRHQPIFGRTLLHEAVCNDNRRCVRHLLRAGAPVNAPNDPEHGWTPIHEAVVHAGSRMCALLLLHGADCLQRNADGVTALSMVAQGSSSRSSERQIKRQVFRVWLAPDQMSRVSVYDFAEMPRSMRDRIRTFLLCWTRARRENMARDECETANLGHLDRLCLNVVLEILWKEERRLVLESFALADSDDALEH
jgi:hypothetical protein